MLNRQKDLIHPGKEQDSLKKATYSFTLDVIAIPKEEQKVKILVGFSEIRTTKVQYTSVKEFRKSSKLPLSLL